MIDYHSASSLRLWDECKRRWGIRYLAGIETPPNESAQRGLDAHESLAGYLSGTIEAETLPAWLRVGVPHLPAPKTPGMSIEGRFRFTIRGHNFVGFQDVHLLNRVPPLVIDHKTTKNLRYAKKPDELRTDIQAVLYAADAMQQSRQRECDLLWLYYRAPTSDDDPDFQPEVKPVQVRVTVADIEPALELAVATANDIAAIIDAGAEAEDLPGNPDACRFCPYSGTHCHMTPEEMLFPMTIPVEQIIKNVKERLAAKGINPPPPPVPAAAPPVPSPVPPPLPKSSADGTGGFDYLPPPNVTPPLPPLPSAVAPAASAPPPVPAPLVGGTVRTVTRTAAAPTDVAISYAPPLDRLTKAEWRKIAVVAKAIAELAIEQGRE